MSNQTETNKAFTFAKGHNGAWYAKANCGEFTVTVHTRAWDEKATKTRLYVGGEAEVDFSAAYEADYADGGPKPRGQRPEVDKLYDSLNRQVVKNKKALLAEAKEQAAVAELLGERKMTFSRKAGCSCGCSAGFILDGMAYAETEAGRKPITSIWIERSKKN